MLALRISLCLLFVGLAVSASGLPPRSPLPRLIDDRFVLYNRTAVPPTWERVRLASSESRVEFTLALRQRNLDILEKWFWEVSDPLHRNYQKYKSIEEIRELVSPNRADRKKVISWLRQSGIASNHFIDYGDSLDVHTSVAHASRMFQTPFYLYKHSETGAEIIRQFGEYSVPASLSHLITMVTGISSFPIPHLRVLRNNASNDFAIIPARPEQRSKLLSSADPPSQGVIEFQGQSFSPADLQTFGDGLNESILPVPPSQIVGPNRDVNPQVEASVDIQQVAGISLNGSSWFWLENGNGWLYQFATHFFSTESVPQVASISYAWWEGDQCTIAPDECQQLGVDSAGYVAAVNVQFQKIGTRGVSLICASGDSGANGRTDPECQAPQLRPDFPAVSPFVTSVGATELLNPVALADQPPLCSNIGLTCAQNGTEQAVSYGISNFASGGGFSDLAPMPDYQSAAVAKYLQTVGPSQLPPPSYFNQSGRAHPDVAALGHNLILVTWGIAHTVGGTSCAAPIWAAVVAMLNAASIQKTGQPLGFLNPFLYKMWADEPSCFQDITVGDNKCTEDGCPTSCQGYICAPGWDPVSGLGTPNFTCMLKYVQEGRHMLPSN